MKLSHFLEFVTLAALWGASFLFMRIAAPEFGAIALVAVRIGIATAVLLPLLFYKKGVQLWTADSKHILVLSVANTAIPYTLFAYATVYLSAGYTSVINSTAPLWAALSGYLWFKVRLNRATMTGLFIGFIGVVTLTYQKLIFDTAIVSSGVIAALFATFLYGVAVNYTKKKLNHVDALTITTQTQLQSGLLLLPLALFFWPQNPISLDAWLSAIIMGSFCTAVALLLYFRLIKNVGPAKAIAVTYLIPVFGMFFGWLILGEQITLTMLAGMVLILAGTALTMGFVKLGKQ